MEYIKFYNMPHYYILLTSQVINCTWLGIVRDSCWFDPSFASCRTDLTKDWELLGPEFILAPLSKMYNNKEEEPEIHRLAIYPQQCSGAWSEYGTHFFQFIQEAQMLLCCQYLIFSFLSVQQFVCPTSSAVRAGSASSWSSSVTPFRIASTALTSSCVVRGLFLTFRCCVGTCSTPLCRALVFAEQYSFREEYFRRAFRTILRETLFDCAQYLGTWRAAAKPGVAF